MFHGEGKDHIVHLEWFDYRPNSHLQDSGVDPAKEAEEWTFPIGGKCVSIWSS